MVRAIASVMAGRPQEALQTLDAGVLNQELDALFWRTIARARAHDYNGRRLDAIEARSIADTYPVWARNAFQSPAPGAAVEADDPAMADRLLEMSTSPASSPATSRFITCCRAGGRGGRARPGSARHLWASDCSEVRPTRAEAVFARC